MELGQVMEQKSFVIVGDTLNEEKYAARIKRAMLEQGYQVQCVGKELPSLNNVIGEIDVVDLCIRADGSSNTLYWRMSSAGVKAIPIIIRVLRTIGFVRGGFAVYGD